MCSSPLASARSVPGSGCRCRAALRAVAGAAGVDDDVLGPARAARVEVLHRRRHGVGRVAADQDDDVGLGDVAERERHAAVEPERPVGRARGRGHAEPAVVVDGAGAQRDAGELAELVGLLVGQRPAAEAADGVAAVAGLGALDRVDQPAEGVVPGGLDQRAGAVAGRRADQRAGAAARGGRAARWTTSPWSTGRPCWSGSRPARGSPGGRRRSRSCRTAASSRGSGSASSAPSRRRARRTGERRRRACDEGRRPSFPIDGPGVNAAFRRPHGVRPGVVRSRPGPLWP